jgi:hypothetical protein
MALKDGKRFFYHLGKATNGAIGKGIFARQITDPDRAFCSI